MLTAIAQPLSVVEPVTEVLHGVTVADPFRWLESQDSPCTRTWVEEQSRYTRAYLDAIPGRAQIQQRIHELLDVETYDSFRSAGGLHVFRKRLAGDEQPGIYMRRGAEGDDTLLLAAASRGCHTAHTALLPISLAPNGRFLLYEVKEGGEQSGVFEILDVDNGTVLPDALAHGYLRGAAFSADSSAFYYVHEPLSGSGNWHQRAYKHVLGTPVEEDQEIFRLSDDRDGHLYLASDGIRLGLSVYRFAPKLTVDFLVRMADFQERPVAVLTAAEFFFAPILSDNRIFAMTDLNAPNRRIVEIKVSGESIEWIDVIPETDSRLIRFAVLAERIVASYVRCDSTTIHVFTTSGTKTDEVPSANRETIRFESRASDTLFLDRESFTCPTETFRYSPSTNEYSSWARRIIPFASENYACSRIWFTSRDKTQIPMWLVGRKDLLARGTSPVIMTSYGGFGTSMTPQFSVFVSFLMERGCLFALPNIRGGSEFGAAWHEAGKRQKRANAYDDFIGAAEWLIQEQRTTPDRLAIFGGSNSGLLVAVAMTKRPELFRAVICMVPLLDMIRYHLFDAAAVWRDEYGTAEDFDDFRALYAYSPYHNVCDDTAYPATMIVSGDADQHCNPLHARKMTARLQMANASDRPVILAYSKFRGHSPVLPLSERIEGLVDRMAFICEQLEL
jgi:prolyl oligopeptidase